MDITKTTEPRSDQINFDDVSAASITVTISEVRKGSTDQPVELHLAEYPGRPYKPGKSMRRVLVAAWGADASKYVGRRLHLYGDPDVKFGGQSVGGIRIRAMSHIPGPARVNLTVTRGKREPFEVLPLASVEDAAEWLRAASSLQELQAAWGRVQQVGIVDPDLVALKDERKAALSDSN